MDDIASCRRHGEAADAGVAEQVEELRRFHARHLPAHPFPHRRHVGKEAEMPERGASRGEADLVPCERPAIARHGPGELPAAAALLIGSGDEFAIGVPRL